MQHKQLIKTMEKRVIKIQQQRLVVNHNIKEWRKQFCYENLFYTIFFRKIIATSS